VALGLLIGFVEGWSVGGAVYFTFVTGLTIGYGDIVPRQALARTCNRDFVDSFRGSIHIPCMVYMEYR
jgi:Ion channel